MMIGAIVVQDGEQVGMRVMRERPENSRQRKSDRRRIGCSPTAARDLR